LKNNSVILITGGNGLVGTSLVAKLRSLGYNKILAPPFKMLDLRKQNEVDEYFRQNNIEYVFHLAARVGGARAKESAPAEFLYENIIMSCNVIQASKDHGVKKLLFMGSSTVYPMSTPQPLTEENFELGPLESVNEGYALAKIVGMKLCERYSPNLRTVVALCSNLYGPSDNFENHPHVIPSMMLKMHSAKKNDSPSVDVGGSGNARREFLFVDDVVDAVIFLVKLDNLKPPFINVGVGKDVTVRELVLMIKDIVGYKGQVRFDASKPEGVQKRLLDIKKIAELGWTPKVDLKEGLERTYKWFLKNKC
jgi:GDP-L-fucose synthase